jgi:tetratricopeptide (TPR) repeat protein
LRKVKKIENLKDKGINAYIGNTFLKENKFEESYEAYSEALSIDPFNKKLNAIIYANRALALMK